MVEAALSEAIERVEALPGDPAAWAELAALYQVHLYLHESLACYEQVEALRDLDARERYWRALALYQIGDAESAIRAAQQAVALAPDTAPVSARLGSWLLEVGRIEEAGEVFRRAAEAAPNSDAVWAGLAKVHLQRHEGERAEAVIREHLLGGSSERYARHLLASALRLQRRVAEAAEQSARAESAAPRWPDPWAKELFARQTGYRAETARANALLREGKLDETQRLLDTLASHYPDDLGVMNLQAVVHFRRGETEDAFDLWRACIEADPAYVRAHLNLGMNMAQLAARGRADPDDALARLDRALELDPASASGWHARGYLLESRRRTDEAIESYRRVLDIDPDHTAVLRRLARIEMSRDGWSAAQKHFERLLEILPGDVPSRVGLARATIELGDLERAEAIIDRMAAEAPPNHPLIRGLRLRLSEVRERQGDG